MPRRLLKRLAPSPEALRRHWALRPFARFFGDPRLWSPQRRTVAPAFGAGLAICFVPLPIHIVMAAITAIVARVNVPTIMLTILLVNPLTVLPIYYLAFRLGVAVTGMSTAPFAFELSWNWLQNGLGPMWKPFLIGCGLAGLISGAVGWMAIDLLWRWNVRYRYRTRGALSTRQ